MMGGFKGISGQNGISLHGSYSTHMTCLCEKEKFLIANTNTNEASEKYPPAFVWLSATIAHYWCCWRRTACPLFTPQVE